MRRVILASVIGLALLVAPVALAAPPKLEVQSTFGKALFPGTWQPVTITVTNSAENPALRGRLVLVVDSRDRAYESAVTYTQPVELPAGQGVSQARFLIRVPSDAPRFVIRLLDEAGRVVQMGEESIALAPEGSLRLLAVGSSKPLPLANTSLKVTRSSGTLHVAKPVASGAMTPGGSMPPSMMGTSGMAGAPQQGERVWTIASPATVLGEQARDYDAFALIYLGPESPWERLTEHQQAALLRYVRQGGVLVRHATESRVQHLGLGTIIQTDQVSTLDDWLKIARDGVSGGSALSNAMWSEEEDLPNNGLQAPPFATLALFLGIYLLAVVPAQYLILRRLDKREWAWGTTPLLACGFAVTAYQFGTLGRSTATFHNISSTIELGAGSGAGSAVSSVWVYSPKRATYTLTVPSAETVFIRPAGFRGNQPTTVDLGASGQELTLTNFAIPQWSMRGAVVRNEVRLGDGVAIELKRKGDQLTGVVTNNTGHTLTDASLVARGARLYLNTLAPGAKQAISLLSVQGATLPRMGMETFVGDPDEAILKATCNDTLVPVQLDGKPSVARQTGNTIVVHARVQ